MQFIIDYFEIIFAISFFSLCLILFKFKKYNLIILIFSIHLSVILLAIYYNFFIVDQKIYLDKRDSIVKKKDYYLSTFPSNFLQKKDGRNINTIIDNYKNKIIPIEFPLAPAPKIKSMLCIEGEGYVFYKSDRFGFRNRDNLWETKFHDLAITGDSFSDSSCVQKTITDYLNDNGIKSVTIGSGGNGPITSYASVKEYLKYFETKYIYNIVTANDFIRKKDNIYDTDFERELYEEALLKYLNDDSYYQDYFNAKNLENYRNFVINFSEESLKNYKKSLDLNLYFEILSGKDIYKLPVQYFRNKKVEYYDFKNLNKDDYKKLLKLYRKFYDLNNKKNIFVIIPNKYCFMENGDAGNKYIYETLEKIIPSNKILNLHDMLCKKKLFALNWQWGGHYNKEGYKILSDHIRLDYNQRIK